MTTSNRNRLELSRFDQCFLWFAAWFVVMLYVLCDRGFGRGIVAWAFFPCGLAPHLEWRLDGFHVACLAFGWILYGALSMTALTTRRVGVYFTLFAILVFLLVLDVRGIRTLVEQWEHAPFAT